MPAPHVPETRGCQLGAALTALKRDQHVQVTCRFLTKGNERLIFSRVVPSIEGIHIRELYDYDSLWFPVASFGHFVASALCQIASAVLGDQRPDLRPVFLEFSRIGDDVRLGALSGWRASTEDRP